MSACVVMDASVRVRARVCRGHNGGGWVGSRGSVADLRDVASFRSHVLLPQTGDRGLVVIRCGQTEVGTAGGAENSPVTAVQWFL